MGVFGMHSSHRLLDHEITWHAYLSHRLLDTGNLDVILKLHAKLPSAGRTGGRLQTMLFSATLHTAEVLAETVW